MLRGSDTVKWQQWTERLERFAKSGETVSEFCRAEGVSSPSFYQWRRKLGGVNGSNRKLAQGRSRRRKSSTFKELHVSPRDVLCGVKIRLPDGIVVDLGSDLLAIEKIVGQLLNHQASMRTGSC